MTNAPPTVTLIETHRLGDAVLALPFVHSAHRAGWRVTVAAPPGTSEVFRLLLSDDEIVEIPRTQASTVLRNAREKWGSTTAVAAWADPRIHLLMVRAGFTRRIGFPAAVPNLYAREAALLSPHRTIIQAVEHALHLALGPLLTDPIVRTSLTCHHAENWRLLAERLGFPLCQSLDSWPSLSAHTDSVSTWLVHRGAGAPWKLWSDQNWLTLLHRMSEAGFAPQLVEGPGIPPLPQWRGGRVHFETVLSFAQATRQARGLVGLDSFPAHLAAAQGRSVVAIFGAMNPTWFAPRGPKVRVVHTPDFWPIRRSHLPALGGSLLAKVTPDHVWQEITRAVETSG